MLQPVNRLLNLIMKIFSLFLLLFVSVSVVTEQKKSSLSTDDYYPLLRKTFNDTNAYKTVAFTEQRWRIAGNTGFNEVIYYVEKILQQAGFKKEIKGEADARLTYRIEKRKTQLPAWDPINAVLKIEGATEPLLQFSSNRNMLAIYSASTAASGVTAEVIDVGKGTAKDFEGKEVKAKIVFGETSGWSLYKLAVEKGAVGVLVYNMPAYTQPEKYIHSVQFGGIPYTDSSSQKWGIFLSYDAKEKIKTALAKGTTRVNVIIDSRTYHSEELTLVADIKGSVKQEERFVFSAHVQEPGANDNATGVGTLAEMAVTAAKLVQQQKFLPQRSITFLWGDEIISTGRYINEDTSRARGIKWGLSLDMVGEDITKTSGSFLIEKMPDPSSIWTRGNDRHTAWGGETLKEEDLFPNYFTDLLVNCCKKQALSNGWVVNTNPYEGGSDHTPFVDAKIPGLLMWHFTDVFYHTNADRLDMVSAAEMKNAGVSALAAAFILTAADEKTTLLLIDDISKNAMERLNAEFLLSKQAIKNGGTEKKEQHIIEVWANWYKEAINKMSEIRVNGITNKIQYKITAVQNSIEKKKNEIIRQLQHAMP
jgi:aminopeptidase YwaD